MAISEGDGGTHHIDLASDKCYRIEDEDHDGADNKDKNRTDIEIIWPERKVEGRGEMSVVVD